MRDPNLGKLIAQCLTSRFYMHFGSAFQGHPIVPADEGRSIQDSFDKRPATDTSDDRCYTHNPEPPNAQTHFDASWSQCCLPRVRAHERALTLTRLEVSSQDTSS